MLQIAPA